MQNMYVSPCQSKCKIEQKTNICVGCGRTLKEISEWSGYHHHQRMKIMKRLGYGQRRSRPRSISNDGGSS